MWFFCCALQVCIDSIRPRMIPASLQRFSLGIRSVGIVDDIIYVCNGDGSLYVHGLHAQGGCFVE